MIIKMARNKVQDDPSVTCSYGLHVAALGYAVYDQAKLGDGRVVVVKVNPRDVVSVPTDYNNQKMRVCEYTVVEDYKGEVKQEDVVNKSVTDEAHYTDDCLVNDEFDDDDDWEDEEEICDDCGQELDYCSCDLDDDDDEAEDILNKSNF
jgi:hypothetical protein